MKTPTTLLFLLLAIGPFSSAQVSGLVSVLEQVPTCAISCLTTAIVESPCGLTNQTCICTNSPLQSSVEACVLRSCTVQQGLTTKNATMTVCGAPVRNRVTMFRTINITLIVISATCVLTRLIHKAAFSMAELGWDDYFVLATFISGVSSAIINHRGMTANGLGRDIWTLRPDQITNFVRSFYIMAILYFLELTLLKLSLLFFFLRILPVRLVKRIIWATIVFDILFGIAFVITAIFQCRPISFYWTSWDGIHRGKCLDLNAITWSNAAINIALDFWMLAIPLSQVISLKLAWRKKVGVCLMFFVGTFVTVISILRLQSLVHFAHTNNPTWDYWGVSNWSTIEINVGIMCACMPAIRVTLVRLFPKVLGSTRGPSKYSYAKYGSRSKGIVKGANSSSEMRGHLGSHLGRDKCADVRERSAITYTKTFEVQHGDSDEVQLVQMDELSAKGTKTRSNLHPC